MLSACQPDFEPPPVTVTPDENALLEEQRALEQQRIDSTPIIVLDGATILTRGELESRLDAISLRFENTPGRSAVSSQWRDDRRRVLIERTIDNFLLRRHVESNLSVPSKDETLAHLRTSNPQIYGNDELFERYLTSQHIAREEFLDAQAIDLALLRHFRENGLLELTKEELADFFDGQKERMRAKERILLSSITLLVTNPSSKEEAERLSRKLAEVRDSILTEKTTFEEASLAFGQGPERAQNGDLGWIQRGEDRLLRLADIERTLFSSKVGFISEPVQTLNGIQIYWVRDRRAAGLRQIDEVQDAISQPILHRKRRVLREELLRELRESALIEINEAEIPWETGGLGN